MTTQVKTGVIADNAITTAKIADANITTAKIADGAITTAKLASGSVATIDIADSAVTTAKIADANVTTAKLVEGSGSHRSIPQSTKTAAYTLTAADQGTHIAITTGGVTVPSGVFAAGDAISIYNNSAASQTITQGAGVTLYIAGTATTGNRTLAQRGFVTILCVAANTFVINGGGLA